MADDPGEQAIRHRLAAILAADAAGYSRLMAADERATVDALERARATFRDRIAAHGGRVVDMAGDSVLAVFETAAGAVRAAVDTQQRLTDADRATPADDRLRFRIGVHLGDIMEKAEDGTVYGDGVNVAARLQGVAEPGGIMLSAMAHDAVEGKLDLGFAYAGAHEVKNIPRPVRAYRLVGAAAAKVGPRRRRARVVALAAIAVAAIAFAVWWQALVRPSEQLLTAAGEVTNDPVLAMPTGPSIAVLPFDNLTGDAAQDYFSDGMTEEIITELSRFRELLVLARNTTFQFKGRAVDVRALGRELGVRYVLEGSVRKAGDTVRVSAQLLDSADGANIWAETFERNLTAANLFEVQDAITGRIVATVADQQGVIFRSRSRSVRDRRTGDLNARECILRAYEYHYSRDANLFYPVRDCLARAIEADPAYADAWAWSARMTLEEHAYGYAAPETAVTPPLDRALDYARRATELDPENQTAQYILARTHFIRHERDPFLAAADRALGLNPNNAAVVADLGMLMSYVGPEHRARGIALLRKAIALNPRHPDWYYLALFWTHYLDRDYETALKYAQKINMPKFFWRHLLLAAVYGQLGRTQEAEAALRDLRALYPDIAERAREELEIWFYDEAAIGHALEGLEKAGLF